MHCRPDDLPADWRLFTGFHAVVVQGRSRADAYEQTAAFLERLLAAVDRLDVLIDVGIGRVGQRIARLQAVRVELDIVFAVLWREPDRAGILDLHAGGSGRVVVRRARAPAR